VVKLISRQRPSATSVAVQGRSGFGGEVTPAATRARGLIAAAVALMMMAGGVARAADRAATEGARDLDPAHVAAAVRMMRGLAVESVHHGTAIRDAYAPAVATLALANRASLRKAIANGSIMALPPDVAAHNLRPRLTGRHPIGEADLLHQHLYLGARPETVGLLLEVASRVRSAPLEVTSLARHEEYQRRLARTNANARTAVPTHAMGLAFDISILHTSLAHATEIRDVLRAMARDGDLHFVAEQRQLVFHVVPAPARRAHFAAQSHLAGAGDPRPHRPHPMRTADADATPALRAAAASLPNSLERPANGAVAEWPIQLLAIVGLRAVVSLRRHVAGDRPAPGSAPAQRLSRRRCR
jgi:hypothetical protein